MEATTRPPGVVPYRGTHGTITRLLVLDLVLPEQVLPVRELRDELLWAQVAADDVLGVGVDEAHVVLEAGHVGVVGAAVRALAGAGARAAIRWRAVAAADAVHCGVIGAGERGRWGAWKGEVREN